MALLAETAAARKAWQEFHEDVSKNANLEKRGMQNVLDRVAGCWIYIRDLEIRLNKFYSGALNSVTRTKEQNPTDQDLPTELVNMQDRFGYSDRTEQLYIAKQERQIDENAPIMPELLQPEEEEVVADDEEEDEEDYDEDEEEEEEDDDEEE